MSSEALENSDFVRRFIMAECKRFSFDKLPRNLDELKALSGADLKDPFNVAALAVAVICRYPADRDDCFAMLDHLRGPSPMSVRDKQFIRDRFMDGKDYVPRSYFDGAVPENDYEPATPYTISVFDNAHSRDIEGCLRLFVTSGGADSPRPITLRIKPSTGEWFLWEYSGILTGIRTPVSKDPWA